MTQQLQNFAFGMEFSSEDQAMLGVIFLSGVLFIGLYLYLCISNLVYFSKRPKTERTSFEKFSVVYFPVFMLTLFIIWRLISSLGNIRNEIGFYKYLSLIVITLFPIHFFIALSLRVLRVLKKAEQEDILFENPSLPNPVDKPQA
jgi:hypothetical protein